MGGDEGDRRKRDRDEGSGGKDGKEERSSTRVESNNDEMKKEFHADRDRDSRFSGPGARSDRGMDIGDRGLGFDRGGPDRGNQNGGGGDRGSDRGNYPSHLQRAQPLPFRGGGGRGGGGPFNDR